jgi:hypothetical protein
MIFARAEPGEDDWDSAADGFAWEELGVGAQEEHGAGLFWREFDEVSSLETEAGMEAGSLEVEEEEPLGMGVKVEGARDGPAEEGGRDHGRRRWEEVGPSVEVA